jgi:hypothetical protein
MEKIQDRTTAIKWAINACRVLVREHAQEVPT